MTTLQISSLSRPYPLAIVGATGNVGRLIVQQLLDREISPSLLHLSASKPSTLTLEGHTFNITTFEDLPPCPLYLLATEAPVSQHYISRLLARENPPSFILDSSSAFRLDPDVPLLSPLINAHLLTPSHRLYAHANCVASPLSLALAPLMKWGLQYIFVSTYQSISGAGHQAVQEFTQSSQAFLQASPPQASQSFPRFPAFNAFPEIGVYEGEGPTGEESKIKAEVTKILGLEAPLDVTSVRVPTLRGHSMTVSLQFKGPISLPQARQALAEAPGIMMSHHYHSPQEVVGHDHVFIGRLRQNLPHTLQFWICSDNLRRGASTDLVESALYATSLLDRACLEACMG